MKTKQGTEETQSRSLRPAAAIYVGGSHTTSGFSDNRSSTLAQRKLIQGIDNSPQNNAQRQLQVQMNAAAEPVQREVPEGERLLQGELETLQKKGNKTGLPDDLKSGMESLSGQSLDHVRVHYNSSKPAAVQAYAYAQGSEVHLAAGQEKHLPHELGHVVQQRQGWVKPTMQMAGEQINDDVSLEREADVMGGRALQMVGAEQKARPDPDLSSDNRAVADVQKNLQHILQNSTLPSLLKNIVQRQYSRANWMTMSSYNSGTAAKEVLDAFAKAGYVVMKTSTLTKVIIPLMNNNDFGKQKWAHGKGDEESGHQGDTDERIQKCKNFLIDWASSNPYSSTSSSSSSSYKVSKKDIEWHSEKKSEKKEQRKIKKRKLYLQSQSFTQQSNQPQSAYEDPSTPSSSKFLIEIGLTQGKYPPTILKHSKNDQIYNRLLEKERKKNKEN